MEINIPIDDILKNCYSKEDVDKKLQLLKEEIFNELALRIQCVSSDTTKTKSKSKISKKEDINIIEPKQDNQLHDDAIISQQVIGELVDNAPTSNSPVYSDFTTNNSSQYEFISFDQSRFQ